MVENKNPSCWAGFGELSKKMRCCRTTAKKAVKSLKGEGLISIGKKEIIKGGLDRNVYKFTDKFYRALNAIGQETTYPWGRRRPRGRAGDALGVGQETPSSKQLKKQDKKQSSSKQRIEDFGEKISEDLPRKKRDKKAEEKAFPVQKFDRVSDVRWLAQKSEYFRSKAEEWIKEELENFSEPVDSEAAVKSWLISQIRHKTKKGLEFWDQYTSEDDLKEMTEGMFGKKQDNTGCKVI
jgi:hypothetical protein